MRPLKTPILLGSGSSQAIPLQFPLGGKPLSLIGKSLQLCCWVCSFGWLGRFAVAAQGWQSNSSNVRVVWNKLSGPGGFGASASSRLGQIPQPMRSRLLPAFGLWCFSTGSPGHANLGGNSTKLAKAKAGQACSCFGGLAVANRVWKTARQLVASLCIAIGDSDGQFLDCESTAIATASSALKTEHF